MTLGLCTTYDLKKKSLFSNSSTISWTIRKFSHRFEMKMYGWISLRRVVISMNLYSTCSVHCCHHHRHLVLRFGVHMSTINQSKIVQNAPFIASNTPSLQHNHCEIPLHTINNSSRTILHTLTHTHTSDIFRRPFPLSSVACIALLSLCRCSDFKCLFISNLLRCSMLRTTNAVQFVFCLVCLLLLLCLVLMA